MQSMNYVGSLFYCVVSRGKGNFKFQYVLDLVIPKRKDLI